MPTKTSLASAAANMLLHMVLGEIITLAPILTDTVPYGVLLDLDMNSESVCSVLTSGCMLHVSFWDANVALTHVHFVALVHRQCDYLSHSGFLLKSSLAATLYPDSHVACILTVHPVSF